VKLAGEGQHYAALGELAGQCRNYVRDRNGAYESGVLPKLGQGGGLRSTDDGRRRMDPDGGIFLTNGNKRQKHFMWDLEVQFSAGHGQARGRSFARTKCSET